MTHHTVRTIGTCALTLCCVLSAGVCTLSAGVATAATAPPGHHQQQHQPAAGRQVLLDGAVNVRDLGGYRSHDGRTVRHGLVFRADALNQLTATGRTRLAGLGMREVVDFRTSTEVARDGADRLPEGLAVTARPVDDSGLSAEVDAVIATRDPVAQRKALGGGAAEALMRGLYRGFVSDPGSSARFAATLRDLARHDSGPLLFHCSSGKDRTGWMSYLLLRILGVPQRTAEADYLASNTYRSAADAQTRAGLRSAGLMQDPGLLIPVQEVRPAYLDAALDQVRRDYGSLDHYLTRGLGLDHRTLAALQARLLH
ncbi:tyrosine-protein phosphatase [Streptomyces sp. NBC_01387]|uniref:tyrosine-protein phosphatase n=1 Tax=unclassified Streptomyces TaxID=2593676 RepID=UPI002250085F|nr:MULTISPECIES: tyrosine-protein phosphatase [unclassified Streptomyces]MCX4552922.1 tyrosine-protein phosphatase [Streptomyces sp. NBC_01500]WSC24248.1 tyrosine-protein phosphatase [Streptomyces sp. NBC_01766]WSV58135.1 tyrosine-protein phosphatase [Streptomyces sp. NBC_01014]